MRVLATILMVLVSASAWAQLEDPADLVLLSLEELLELRVTTASKFSEPISEIPSSLVVLTAERIADLGYSDLLQLLQELAGLDVMVTNGATHANTFVRGNRTEIADRMLVFINGVNFQSLGFQNMDLNRMIPQTGFWMYSWLKENFGATL